MILTENNGSSDAFFDVFVSLDPLFDQTLGGMKMMVDQVDPVGAIGDRPAGYEVKGSIDFGDPAFWAVFFEDLWIMGIVDPISQHQAVLNAFLSDPDLLGLPLTSRVRLEEQGGGRIFEFAHVDVLAGDGGAEGFDLFYAPEPSTIVLFALPGLFVVATYRRRKRAAPGAH